MATSMVLVLRQSTASGNIGSVFERLGSKPAPAQQKPAAPTQAPITIPAQPAPAGQPGQAPAQNPTQQQPPAPAKKP